MSEAAITKSRGAKRRRAKQFTMGDARTGRYLTVKEGAHEPLPKEFGRVLSMSTNSVAVVIDALRAAVSQSRIAGTPLQFVVEVEPNGKLARRWSVAFHEHPQAVDGIIYPSRLNGEHNLAIYGGAVPALRCTGTVPLLGAKGLVEVIREFKVALA